MSTTAEVRWFFEGQVPDEIEQWFCRSNLALKAAPREDHYLLFPAVLGLGLKMREGRLEVKSLIKTLGVRSFTADVAGNVQVWEKEADGEPAATSIQDERFQRRRFLGSAFLLIPRMAGEADQEGMNAQPTVACVPSALTAGRAGYPWARSGRARTHKPSAAPGRSRRR